MPYRPSPPWPKILNYLAEVGSARDARELAYKASALIGGLISHDCPAGFVIADGAHALATYGEGEKMAEEYNYYYGALFPLRGHLKAGGVSTQIKWTDYENTEYVADYLRRYNVWYTIGTSVYQNTLVLNRSRRGSGFSRRELVIVDIISPHLHNLYSCLTKEGELDPGRIHAAEIARGCRVLSRREAEVAALLCRRLRTAEIATKLLISPNTVQRHIANIYEKLRVRNRRQLLLKLLGNKVN